MSPPTVEGGRNSAARVTCSAVLRFSWLGSGSELSFVSPAVGHSCLLFEDGNEQKKAVLPFIKQGLEDGEQCFYIGREASLDDWLFEFQTYGIDVQSEQERGALRVTSSWHSSRPGATNSIDLARRLWAAIESGLASFSAIRCAADMTLTLETGVTVSQLCHWEATINPLIEDEKVRMFCLYDLRSLSTGAIHSALRTHPSVVRRVRAVSNPYYEAYRILENEPYLNDSDADAAAIQAMLANLDAQQ